MPNRTDSYKQLHDQLISMRPEGAEHDEKACLLCNQDPSGGDLAAMEEISKETHEALLAQAVQKAVEEQAGELQTLRSQLETVTAERDDLSSQLETVKGDTERLTGELDAANVELRTANDKVTELTSSIEKRDEEARLAEVASARAEEVRGLELFEEDYVSEKASAWAELSDDAWSERVADWKAMRRPEGDIADDTASAMSGGSAPKAPKTKSHKRAVLGLGN